MQMLPTRGWWNQRQYDEQAENEYRIPISKANLTPWHWKGLRGEMVTIAFGSAFFLLVYVHAWKAALVVPILILCIAKMLHQWHPFWIEILVRLLVQPEGYQDS
jgi:hypothetical protein